MQKPLVTNTKVTLSWWFQPAVHPSITHRLIAGTKKLRIIDGVTEVGTDDVEPQTLWWFISHLDTILQDGNWESSWWVAGQPQSEVRMGRLWVKFLEQEKIMTTAIILCCVTVNFLPFILSAYLCVFFLVHNSAVSDKLVKRSVWLVSRK